MQDNFNFMNLAEYEVQAACAWIWHTSGEWERKHDLKIWVRVSHLVALPCAVVPIKTKEMQHGVFCGAVQSSKQACQMQQTSGKLKVRASFHCCPHGKHCDVQNACSST